MADVFVEYMVAKRTTGKDILIKASLSLAAVLTALLPFILTFLTGYDLSMFFPLTLVGSGWGMIILFRRLNLEYEYIVTNGEMDVDKIMGKSVRKRLMTIDCRNFDILAPYTEEFSSDINSATISKRMDVSSGAGAAGRWFAVFNAKDGIRTLLIFEPSEKMLDAFRLYIRNKIKG